MKRWAGALILPPIIRFDLNFDKAMTVPPTWSQLNEQAIYDALTQLCQGNLEQNAYISSNRIYLNLYDQVASTNATLWNLIQQGARAGTVAIARQQSAGKGQRGRQWQSPLGGLYLSLALEPNLPVQQAPHLILSIVCGVAIALRSCHIPVQIKWPNDLVISIPSPSRKPSAPKSSTIDTPTPNTPMSSQLYKLGGILTETRIHGQSISHAVVGIGLNGANPVPEPGITLTSVLAQLNLAPVASLLTSLNGLAAIAIYGILAGWQRRQQDGIGPILKDYNALLAHRNHIIAIPLNGQHQTVRILRIEASGDLVVQTVSDSTDDRSQPTSFPPKPAPHLAGTSSWLQPPYEDVRIPPGTIQLGYRE